MSWFDFLLNMIFLILGAWKACELVNKAANYLEKKILGTHKYTTGEHQHVGGLADRSICLICNRKFQ